MLIRKNPEIFAALLDNDWCIFIPSTASYLNLNSTGSFLWELLEETDDFNIIVERVLETYNISIEDCKEKLKNFFEHAETQKIVHINYQK